MEKNLKSVVPQILCRVSLLQTVKRVLMTYLKPSVFFSFLYRVMKEVVPPPINNTCQKMTKIKFIMYVSSCSMATKLASSCWTLYGEFSQKHSRVSQVGAQECEASLWEDWRLFGAICVFWAQSHWAVLQTPEKQNQGTLAFQRCQVLCHKYYWNLQVYHRTGTSFIKGMRHIELILSYLP